MKRLTVFLTYAVFSFFLIFLISCSDAFTFDSVLNENQETPGIEILPDINYSVDSIFDVSAATSGGALTGSFTYTNQGAVDGSSYVYWYAYLSFDKTLDSTDPLLNSGVEDPLVSGGSNTIISGISSTWPSVDGVYYIIVDLAADDDTYSYNDRRASAEFTVSDGTGSVNYGNVIVTNTGGTQGGSALSGSFTFENTGTGSGVDGVDWEVYVSQDSSIGAGDTLIDSGSEAALTGSSVSSDVSFSGTWPLINGSGTYYLIVKIFAGDEISYVDNTGSKTVSLSAPDPKDVDYYCSAVTCTPAGDVYLDDALTLDCTYSNIGSETGIFSTYWYLYVSSDYTFDDTDTLINSGIEEPLAAGSSNTITVSDTGGYTITEGARSFVFYVVLQSSEDTDSMNNINYAGAWANDWVRP